MDRLSSLPKPILHDIMSRLSEKEAVRTGVLSKAWEETLSTFPILSFNDTEIIGMTSPLFSSDTEIIGMTPLEPSKRKMFSDYVQKTLQRFCDQGLTIKEFKLIVDIIDLQYISRDINLWMKMASERGFEALELCLPDCPDQEEGAPDSCYTLPQFVLETRSLNKLVLAGGIRVDEAFRNYSTKFSSLRELSLWFVRLGDAKALEHLLSQCPLLEYITLKCCCALRSASLDSIPGSRITQMKSIKLHGLPKLKGVDIQGIQDIYVDAPNLENLCYCPADVNAPCRMNFDNCRNLRKLYLWSLISTIITDKWFLELFQKFPFLESLKLDHCTISERVNISSVQLKVLDFKNCFKLKEVNIDAPNLLVCGYTGGAVTKPVISFLKCSSQLEVNVLLYMDYTYLWHFQEFIQNLKPHTVLASVSLFIHQAYAVNLKPCLLLVSSLPPRIKHLNLHTVPKNQTLYLQLVNRLLSICCPETISMSLHSFFCPREFIKFFYDTLIRRNGDDCYCSSLDRKCWWHELKDVKVTTSVKIDENLDFNTMFHALPNFSAEETISFMLEL